ncbi:menaquinone-dependent protoporphyrinogen IX dehydrogenase [Yersinia massiliensis]|uniref:Protoporphyrinogen IX dehydrogenase [quinone] n=1 Tax=Yersinia massiliensis TaxID=419257 RepID=A0AA90XVB0_9GAMM|nr:MULTISPECIES: menaquinone-dependent protoporphyrinogen IX dehydrogenase [Yersinia]HEC1650207.1 menaquinone-dependent protoporphyrinogen IX dehydrogenase [Yersinia enterocolitica]ATM88275.1 menaquinone-dependent protoporphyrinogen IX dehydrogenase [Yersinia frederiksenii]MCB5319534.1 menaquinone-dependent protoporphyrinogen IX dehydrogenase [Yersinia massiliensis]MDA5548878.1 menaquinone-dependent protoporphyrinogen IX dehydrogenase [Yersinia massiliensis]NIL28694.1 menaquinone-dependent pro
MKVLILYSSRDGQTHTIASYVAKQLSVAGTCEIQDLSQVGEIDLSQYQQVMIGASVRYGRFSPVLSQFVAGHIEQLNQMPSAFFAVNLTARKPEKRSPQTNAYVRKFLLSTPWQPSLCAVFAGALRYPRYRWIDRVMIQLIMRMTGGETDTSKEVEYTDWQQVDRFTQDFAALQCEK